jgi:DNA-binding response OmpR family regulator/DNA-binding CsgD family transcriptional regulator
MTNSNEHYLVLAVDDSPEALSFVHDALEDSGMDVLVALEGKQALTIAKRMRPDIILLDAMMPLMDGFETCAALKAESTLADIPVIFMTGLGDSDHIVKGLEVGGVDYLTKPIQPNELIARIQVHMNNARLQQSAQNALDHAGQKLICVSSDGVQRWSTPGAQTLLGREKRPNMVQLLQSKIAYWLSHSPEPEHSLNLSEDGIAISLKVVSEQKGEWILKLIDQNKPQGSELLRDSMALTERESEVLLWISKGKTNREVAQILTMSPRTVNKHLEQIFNKLQVDNRTSAAGAALSVLAKAEALD